MRIFFIEVQLFLIKNLSIGENGRKFYMVESSNIFLVIRIFALKLNYMVLNATVWLIINFCLFGNLTFCLNIRLYC